MAKRIAIFGGSFNPPHLDHRRMVEALLPHFDTIFVVICGFRTDKAVTNGIDPLHRAVMCDLTFGDLPNVEVVHTDLEKGSFTPLAELDRQFSINEDRWHIVGADLIAGAGANQAKVQRWIEGARIWNECKFAVVTRADTPIAATDLPPCHQVYDLALSGSSTAVRDRRYAGQAISDLVTPAVDRYIQRYGLYDGMHRHPLPTCQSEGLRFGLIHDIENPRAIAMALRVRELVTLVEDQPDVYLVLGGDGTLLRAVREHWRERRPFLGLNLGTVGFLANDVSSDDELRTMLHGPWVVRQSPMLLSTMEFMNGSTGTALAFNDVYMRSANGQTTWLEVAVDGNVVLPRLMGDGVLVASAAGSTAYARAMGATPIPVGTDNLIVVGSNVAQPYGWHSAQLHGDARVRITNVDPTSSHVKRPTDLTIDGQSTDLVHAVTVRASRVAAAELLFHEEYDLRTKLMRTQFPQT